MVSSINHLIGGQFQTSVGSSFHSISPLSGDLIAEGSEASKDDVQQAVADAQVAFLNWREWTLLERYQLLQRYGACLKAEKETLATLITTEMGKPLWEARLEVTAMLNKIDISYQAYQTRCADFQHDLGQGRLNVRHVPHGVLVVMGPFNFPGHLPNGHLVPALLAGNTVVFKPSEYTPLVGQFLGQCLIESGLPSGVVSIVHGGPKVGQYLIEQSGISGVLFTGSSTTGRFLSSYFSTRPEVLLAMEMGGNNALIVDSFDEIDPVVWTIISSAFLTSGQRCTAARRLILVDNDHNRLVLERVVAVTKGLKVGSGLDQNVFMGPLVNEQTCQALLKQQSQLISAGATPLVTLTRLSRSGFFVTPGIVDVSGLSSVSDGEWFGPFLQVHWVASLADAVSVANETQFGLSAAVITKAAQDYHYVRDRLKVGILNWNMPTNGASSLAPFGGVGCSGNFRPSAYYAADYCSYPVASMESTQCQLPSSLPPGLSL